MGRARGFVIAFRTATTVATKPPALPTAPENSTVPLEIASEPIVSRMAEYVMEGTIVTTDRTNQTATPSAHTDIQRAIQEDAL